uniref:Uncharacterized protein n=1 Tax=Ditylenchus dipsaci TaxID=166011 RepID=A0A915DXN6_9BILA
MEAVQGAVEPIELHCSESDLKGWVKVLAGLGIKRNVLFELPGTSLQKDVKSILVKVVLFGWFSWSDQDGYVPQNSREVQTLEGVLPIWKFLGALIGVYYTADVQVSTRIDQWLLWVSESPVNVDQLSRKMSAHLSRYDFFEWFQRCVPGGPNRAFPFPSTMDRCGSFQQCSAMGQAI